jgi:hypothetical protein
VVVRCIAVAGGRGDLHSQIQHARRAALLDQVVGAMCAGGVARGLPRPRHAGQPPDQRRRRRGDLHCVVPDSAAVLFTVAPRLRDGLPVSGSRMPLLTGVSGTPNGTEILGQPSTPGIGSRRRELGQGASDCGGELVAAVAFIVDDPQLAGGPMLGQSPGGFERAADVVATVN